jgi:hypothetical protein
MVLGCIFARTVWPHRAADSELSPSYIALIALRT